MDTFTRARHQNPTRDPKNFFPEFCSRRECPAHLANPGEAKFTRKSAYRRKAKPHRIPRFLCHTCGHVVSSQSYSGTYRLKRPELLVQVAKMITNGNADRHVRRIVESNRSYNPHPNWGAAQSTITRLIPRLGRQALLITAELEQRMIEIGVMDKEPLAVDAFESFAKDQTIQVSVPTPVGHASRFIHALDIAPHRWGGVWHAKRKAKENAHARRGAYPEGAQRAAWQRVMNALMDLARMDATLSIVSDGDHTIAEVLAAAGERVQHRAYPNPPRGRRGGKRSRAARARDFAMRPVDHLHRMIRNLVAHHRRETIAFARSLNGLLSRLYMFALARNVIHPRFERRPNEKTPAMELKLLERPLNWHMLIEMRQFPARTRPLSEGAAECYYERISTDGPLPSKRRLPTFAL